MVQVSLQVAYGVFSLRPLDGAGLDLHISGVGLGTIHDSIRAFPYHPFSLDLNGLLRPEGIASCVPCVSKKSSNTMIRQLVIDMAVIRFMFGSSLSKRKWKQLQGLALRLSVLIPIPLAPKKRHRGAIIL